MSQKSHVYEQLYILGRTASVKCSVFHINILYNNDRKDRQLHRQLIFMLSAGVSFVTKIR